MAKQKAPSPQAPRPCLPPPRRTMSDVLDDLHRESDPDKRERLYAELREVEGGMDVGIPRANVVVTYSGPEQLAIREDMIRKARLLDEMHKLYPAQDDTNRLPRTLADRLGSPPTPLQQAIWNALDAQGLTADALAAEVAGGDRSRLYKPGGIKEMMDARIVRNKRGVGYYRPDAPPTTKSPQSRH